MPEEAAQTAVDTQTNAGLMENDERGQRIIPKKHVAGAGVIVLK